jgi:glycosyltransferase involved in cell wall biosynthesis
MEKINKMISVIIPAFNAGNFIADNVRELNYLLDESFSEYEIIIVIDGFSESEIENNETYHILKKLQEYNQRLHIHYYAKNMGKGFAVRYGMAKAGGEYIGFVDAGYDLDYSYLINMFTIIEKENADLVIGSKLHPQSVVDYGMKRKIISLVYRYLVKVLFGNKYSDTQVGMKVFRKKVIKKILPVLTVNGFAFDIELLTAADRYGFVNIIEAPVGVTSRKEKTKSSVFQLGVFRVSAAMFWDTIKVYFKYKRR